MNTTNKTAVEDRVWVFAASRNGVPYFSKLFTDHTELKEFSANYSDDVKGYSSTYYDLTDKTLLTQAKQQGEQIGVEKALSCIEVIREEWNGCDCPDVDYPPCNYCERGSLLDDVKYAIQPTEPLVGKEGHLPDRPLNQERD